MDEQKSDGTAAEQFRGWLESTTSFSPLTIKNYYFIVRKLLNAYPAPSIEDANRFLAQFTRGKTNGFMARAAMLAYLQWQRRTTELGQVLRSKDVGRKHLESDITLNKLKLLLPHFVGLHRDVFSVQFYSGCREIEAFLIERKNIRFDGDYCDVLITQKGGRTRTIRLPADQFKPIFGKPEYQARKYVFLQDHCQALTRYEIMRDHYGACTAAYLKAWQKACIAAGIDAYASHDARRALIRAISDKHGLKTAQKLAGHVRADTTMGYLPSEGIDTLQAVKDVMRG